MGGPARKSTLLTAIGIVVCAAVACQRGQQLESYPEEYSGIGVELEIDGDYPRVIRTFPGGAADSAGLKTGDSVVAIDGNSTKGQDLGDVVAAIRGPTGSQVVLTIERRGVGPRLIIPVKRGTIAKRANSAVDYVGK